MMNCCQCKGLEEMFSREFVEDELKRYRHRGPGKTTRMLIDGLKQADVEGFTLLDIGGGLGAIQHGLLAAGVTRATDVDASAAYLSVAKGEAALRGLSGRITYKHGNFVEMAPELSPADIVTLDRVICCYDDMERLVASSAALTRRLYGVVYPRDTWWTRLVASLENFLLRLRRSAYRAYVHPAKDVEALLAASGLRQVFYRRTLVWQVVVYSR